MRANFSICIKRGTSALKCLFFVVVITGPTVAESRIAKNAQPIKQTFRMIVPASFSTVGPTPVVFANRESSEQPLQFEPQQWTIHSQSSRGLSVTVSLQQPGTIQRLDHQGGSLDAQLPKTQFTAALQTIDESSFSGTHFQSSIRSVEWLDRENLNWEMQTEGVGRLMISVAPSMVVVDGLSEHDPLVLSPKISVAIITSEVTESP